MTGCGVGLNPVQAEIFSSFSFSTHTVPVQGRDPPPPPTTHTHTHNKQTKTKVQLSAGIHALIRNPGCTKINKSSTDVRNSSEQAIHLGCCWLSSESHQNFPSGENSSRISHLGETHPEFLILEKLTRISHLGKTHQNFPSWENLPLDETHTHTRHHPTHPTPLAQAQTPTHCTQTPRSIHNYCHIFSFLPLTPGQMGKDPPPLFSIPHPIEMDKYSTPSLSNPTKAGAKTISTI